MDARRSFACLSLVLGLGVTALPACTRPRSARRPVQMVPVPPPSEPPHAQARVPVGGAIALEAEEVISCEAEPPGLVRAYATKETLTFIGLGPGRVTVRLRLSAGDEFLLDLDVTSEPIAYRVLALGEQLTLPLENVTAVAEATHCVRATKSNDGAHLIVVAERACTALVWLTMPDGTSKATEIVVVGGERLL